MNLLNSVVAVDLNPNQHMALTEGMLRSKVNNLLWKPGPENKNSVKTGLV